MKFAHITDCHLGSWHAKLQEMNLDAFKKAIDSCIQEKVDFVLITGDLFDAAMPPIDILKEATAKLKELKDAGIECYIIAGSHDFSVSGKTFLDVLEKAGLLQNVSIIKENDGKIDIEVIENKNILIAGISGKKAGMEIPLISKEIVNLENKNKNKFKILALHTTITEAINDSNPEGSKFMNSVSASKLPEGFDYYALGHIHAYFKKNIDGKLIVYPGPLFPNNFAEMKTLKSGNFCIVSVSDDKKIKIENKKIDLNVEVLDIDASGKEPQQLTKEIIEKIWPLKDKIITLKISGKINGNTSEIPFVRINEEAEKNGCVLLKNTSDLENPEFKTEFEIKETDIENIEHEIIKKVSEENSSEFNKLISILMKSLNIEKQEGETTLTYEKRLAQDIEKIIGIA